MLIISGLRDLFFGSGARSGRAESENLGGGEAHIWKREIPGAAAAHGLVLFELATFTQTRVGLQLKTRYYRESARI
jgi:hypothetical protein